MRTSVATAAEAPWVMNEVGSAPARDDGYKEAEGVALSSFSMAVDTARADGVWKYALIRGSYGRSQRCRHAAHLCTAFPVGLGGAAHCSLRFEQYHLAIYEPSSSRFRTAGLLIWSTSRSMPTNCGGCSEWPARLPPICA